MDSHKQEGFSSTTHLSPSKIGFHRLSKSITGVDEPVPWRMQLELARKRIAELESDVQRLLEDDSRTRHRLAEEKQKHEKEVQELQNRLKRRRVALPELLENELGESLASVNSLHKEVLEEIKTMRMTAERRVKDKEFNLHKTYSSRVRELERKLEAQRNLFDSEPPPADSRIDPSLEAKILQYESFNTRLQEMNRALREKTREAQSLNDAYAKQYAAVLKENGRLRQELKAKGQTEVRLSIERLQSVELRPGKTAPCLEPPYPKLSSAQKELQTVKSQLTSERINRSSLLSVLDDCISEVREEAVTMASFSGRFRRELTEREREQVIKHLLSRREVLELVRREVASIERKAVFRSTSVATLDRLRKL